MISAVLLSRLQYCCFLSRFRKIKAAKRKEYSFLPKRGLYFTENFLLAFSREPLLWCVGQIIGWISVPVMSANLDVVLRTSIPVELQGRVYACRNTLQFFTIPIGLFTGGFMVDNVCEPFMSAHGDLSILETLFGTGKGSGAALMMLILGVSGSLICIIAGKKLKRYQY